MDMVTIWPFASTLMNMLVEHDVKTWYPTIDGLFVQSYKSETADTVGSTIECLLEAILLNVIRIGYRLDLWEKRCMSNFTNTAMYWFYYVLVRSSIPTRLKILCVFNVKLMKGVSRDCFDRVWMQRKPALRTAQTRTYCSAPEQQVSETLCVANPST